MEVVVVKMVGVGFKVQRCMKMKMEQGLQERDVSLVGEGRKGENVGTLRVLLSVDR